jgi:hypothetical protein
VRREADVLDLALRLKLLRHRHAELRPLQPLLVVHAVETEQVDVAARRLERLERFRERLTELLRSLLRRDLRLHDDGAAVDLLAELAARREKTGDRAAVSDTRGGGPNAWRARRDDLRAISADLSDWQNCFSEQP